MKKENLDLRIINDFIADYDRQDIKELIDLSSTGVKSKVFLAKELSDHNKLVFNSAIDYQEDVVLLLNGDRIVYRIDQGDLKGTGCYFIKSGQLFKDVNGREYQSKMNPDDLLAILERLNESLDSKLNPFKQKKAEIN